jgi:cell division protein FtsB
MSKNQRMNRKQRVIKRRSRIKETSIVPFSKFGSTINEARDLMRFLKKNKNLSKEQREKINKYFTVTNRQAVNDFIAKYGQWDTKAVRNLTYNDFYDFMTQYKSGIKANKKINCKSIRVPGKPGEDYIRVIMPTKDFCAFIPLNYETAKYMNTRKFGVCSGPWCIGHSETSYHWNDEVIDNKQVPVYVLNKFGKWVIMIQEDNNSWDVWDVDNDPNKTHIQIPGFDVKKNLLSSKQKRMYDEIRDEFYSDYEEEEIPESVIDSYNSLVADIEAAHTDYQNAQEEFYDTNYRIKRETKRKYEREIVELEEEERELEERKDSLEDEIEDIEGFIAELEDKANKFEIGSDEHDEISDEIMDHRSDIETNKKRLKEIDDRIDEIEGEISVLEDIISMIDSIAEYEMIDHDHEIDWVEEPMS